MGGTLHGLDVSTSFVRTIEILSTASCGDTSSYSTSREEPSGVTSVACGNASEDTNLAVSGAVKPNPPTTFDIESRFPRYDDGLGVGNEVFMFAIDYKAPK